MEYLTTKYYNIICSVCGCNFKRKGHSIRVNINRNSEYVCHSCVVKTESYRKKQRAAHYKGGRKHDKIVEIKCNKCSRNYRITHRAKIANKKRNNGIYRCKSCGLRDAHADGKFIGVYTDSFINALNAESAKFWKEHRGMWKEELVTDDFRKAMSRYGKRAKEGASERSKKLWQDPSYREKMAAIYNSPEYRKKMAIVRSQQPRISSIQKILYSWLDDLGVEYEIEKPIGFYTFDCFIPKYNILIECQGDYWHSLKKNIRNDKAKATYIERYFPQYQLKCLWEHEFSAKGRIVGVIKHWLGLDVPELIDFNFSDIEIRKIKRSNVKLLLSKYHYLQNAGNGGVVYGAYLKDELVACCVFSPPTRKEIASRLDLDVKKIRELSRFCIHPSYQKKNFGSWFISRCLKMLKKHRLLPKLVVSFCDTTYNHDGALYKACNFKLDGKTKPDYWYVDDNNYVMHKKTLYQRAVKMQIKEREYAEKNNYIKVWGKEKLRFIYRF